MEINSIQLLIFSGIMVALLCICIWELQKKINDNRELINRLFGQWEKTTDRIREIENSIEELKELIDNNEETNSEIHSTISENLNELFKRLESEPVEACVDIKPSESPNKACEETDEEDIDEEDENENRGITGPNRGIYEWIFPSEGMTEENKPKIGEEYLVIGSVRGSNNVHSSFASWNGAVFKPSEHSPFETYDSFEKVYAYFQLPSPSDVMKEVVDIVAKNGGV